MSGLLQNIELPDSNLPWLFALREKGREAFLRQGLPTAKTEAWKYTRPRDLQVDDFVMQTSPCHCSEECDCEHHSHSSLDDALPFDCYALHFDNGQLRHEHLPLPRGVQIMPLSDAFSFADDIKSRLGKTLNLDKYPFAALNTAYLNEGVYISIAKHTRLDKPLALVYHTHSCHDNLFFNLRNLIVVESGAQAELIEYHHYSGAEKSRYFANIVNEIFVGRDAVLSHYKLQDEAFKAVHIAFNGVKVKGGGAYRSFCLQKGANLARNETFVSLTEEGTSTEVNAAYIMHGWATLDTTTDIEHLAENTISHQLDKGVVGGDAKGVFQGRIHIAPDSQQTEGRQLHQALLLSDRAEVDVKPELEIFADDVKCSHGAASGELDEEQLFYMRSRGIDADEARQILVEAFLDDALMQVEDEAVRIWLKSVLQ